MKYRASKVAALGLLFALSVVLSLVEGTFSPLIPIPGIRLGLSNIVTMYALFCLGWREAYTITALKNMFVLMTRGVIGAMMSFAGGLLSATLMLVLLRLPKGKRPSELFVSICGGLFHNVGQLLIALWLIDGTMIYYFPVLAVAGVAMGALTGILLRQLLPYFQTLFKN